MVLGGIDLDKKKPL